MKIFDFETQMLKSKEGVSDKDNKEILLSCFPTAIAVEEATTFDDKNGTDYWITMQSGQKVSVDLKSRDEDFWKKSKKDDLALETWSVIGSPSGHPQAKDGWTRDETKRTDYIFFLWKDTGRWMLVSFPMLCSIFCKNWKDWRKKYYTQIQLNKGWKSECVFVPRKIVLSEIDKTFGGNPIDEESQLEVWDERVGISW